MDFDTIRVAEPWALRQVALRINENEQFPKSQMVWIFDDAIEKIFHSFVNQTWL